VQSGLKIWRKQLDDVFITQKMAYKMNQQVNQNNSVRLTKHQIRNSMTYAMVSAMAFVIGFSCLQGSVLTLVAIKLGAEELFIGILTFAISMCLLFSIFTINAVEKYGKKKVLIAGYSTAIFFILPLFALPLVVGNWHLKYVLALLFVTTLFRCISNAMGGTGWFPILQDCVPNRLTGAYFSTLRRSWQTAWLVSLLLLAWFLRGSDPSWWRLEIVFLIGFVAYIIRVLAVMHISQQPPRQTIKQSFGIIQKFIIAYKNVEVRFFILYLVFYMSALTMSEPFKIKLLSDFGYGYGFILSATAANCLGAIISLKFWGKLADRFGNRSIFTVSHLGMIFTSFLWIVIEPSLFGSILVFFLYFFWSVFNSGNGIAQTRYMLHAVPIDQQFLMNIIQLIMGLSMAMGPLLGGLFLTHTESLSLSSGAMHLNNYHVWFILTSLFFIIPHLLRKKLRFRKETPTLQVLAIVSRPFRNAFGAFLSFKTKR
jgi:MFS family permease